MKKNDRVVLHCLKLGADLEGICNHEGMIVFVPGLLPGEDGETIIVKVQPNFAFGRLLRVVTPSPERAIPFCPIYEQCGGCSGQHMCYEAGLRAKKEQVLECLNRIGNLHLSEADVPPLLPLEEPFHYRNKTTIPCGGTRENPVLGFYRKRSHDIIPLADCPVAMSSPEALIHSVRTWILQAKVKPYDEKTRSGLLRHVVYRTTQKGQCMVTLCTTQKTIPQPELLIQLLRQNLPGFCSLHISVNAQANNVIFGKTSHRLFGEECLEEELLGLRFLIPPLSFFQVNPRQTEKLYRCAISFAALQPEDTVVDAYAGAGTIALCMAKACREVIGIEIVPQAVEGALHNAALNGICNARFHIGAVEHVLPKLVQEGLRPNAVILDPPRKGCEREVLDAVIQSGAERLVYISCHYPTQARDVRILAENGYRFEKCQGVDMFCWTGGVENIISMKRM